MKRKEIILVTWLDHSSSARGWTRPEDLYKGLVEVETVGFLAGETKDTLSLVQTLNADGEAVHCFNIAKKLITKRRVLR